MMKELTTSDMLMNRKMYVAICQASYLADPKYFSSREFEEAKAYVKKWNQTHDIDWECMCLYELNQQQIYDV